MNAQSSSLIQEGETFSSLWFPSMTDGVPQNLEQWRGQKVVVHLFSPVGERAAAITCPGGTLLPNLIAKQAISRS